MTRWAITTETAQETTVAVYPDRDSAFADFATQLDLTGNEADSLRISGGSITTLRDGRIWTLHPLPSETRNDVPQEES